MLDDFHVFFAVFHPVSLVVTFILAGVLAWVLWTTERHIPNVMFFYVWITGISFFAALCAHSMLVRPTWPIWLATAVLWSWFIGWAAGFVIMARRWCHNRSRRT